MSSFFIEENIKDYIQKINELGLEKTKVYFSSEKNYPSKFKRFDVFFENGELYSFPRWKQFIETIYEKGKEGIRLNLSRTWENFVLLNPLDTERTVVVECYTSDEYKETFFHLDRVYEKQKDKKLKAADFKEWLKNYMAQFPDMGYEHDEYLSVKKMVEQVEGLVNEGSEKTS